MTEARQDPEYIVEYVDGPLVGQTDRRFLVGGEVDERIGVIAAVEGLESTFWYVAGEKRDVEGQLQVSYHFDEPDSDPVAADKEDESIFGFGA
ncbi:hypothetical protein [Leifsonia sp. fls2-241-R2A-40a]|uniref:hypothetical protein n=1 Tax=Leifsonia sp. fls2-241-R2A-40a TaxID=3040290 RepID=UPI00254E58A4|nr:hypothetical protein [Leifsonia sp. fls2-241-R2A-40a]